MGFEITSGYLLASSLEISRTVGGKTTTDTIHLRDPFDCNGHQYLALSVAEFQRLSTADYVTRRDARVSLLQVQYPNLIIDIAGSITIDPDPQQNV